MNREIKARREYAKKYSFMSKPEINQFYNQVFLNEKIDEMVSNGLQNIIHKTTFSTFSSTEKAEKSSNVGESYFVSKVMFDALNVSFVVGIWFFFSVELNSLRFVVADEN